MTRTAALPAAYARLGLKVTSVGEDAATVEATPDAGWADAGGDVHLGFLAALAQAAMEQAIRATIGAGQRGFEFDLKLSRLRPLAAGTAVVARATLLHRGRTTAVAECRITAGDALIAAASGSASIGSVPT
jgi:uncharacterized protein (TIGR00369 family)